MKIEKEKIKRNSIVAFVNYQNEHIECEGIHFYPAMILTMIFNSIGLLAYVFQNERGPYVFITTTFIISSFILSEYTVLNKLKKTGNQKWALLPNNIIWAFMVIGFIRFTRLNYIALSLSSFLYLVDGIFLITCVILINFGRIQGIRKGKYNVRKKQESLKSFLFREDGWGSTLTVVITITGIRSLNRTFDQDEMNVVTIILLNLIIVFLIGMSDGFLKFYYATKYNIKVIPTWLDKYESIILARFKDKTDSGEEFLISIKREKSGDENRYHAEVYALYESNYSVVADVEIKDPEKEYNHIDTLLNENGIVCYALNGAPFGKLSDGRFVDFRRVQFEGEPNPEIVWIGETFIQQNVRWFDDFGEYLVKSNSQIGIEIAKRYQDKNFTEAEIQQIEEHSLDANQIAEWSKEILLVKEKGVDDL